MENITRKIESVDWPRAKYSAEYTQLVKKLNSSDPYVLFIGAGVSKNIYPDWEELVSNISSEMAVELTLEEQGNKVQNALPILERCKTKDNTKFYSIVRTMFNPTGKIEHKPLHYDLLLLPISGFVTTNIDVCLLRAAARLPDQEKLGFYYHPDRLPSTEITKRRLFHIHGIVINHKDEDTVEHIILTQSDYENNYPDKIEPFLRSVFSDTCVIFIGYSLNDPAIIKILGSCKKYQDQLKELRISRTTKDVNHYIFMEALYRKDEPTGPIEEDKDAEDRTDKYFTDTYNVQVVRYHAKDDSEHTELRKIINNLLLETKKSTF